MRAVVAVGFLAACGGTADPAGPDAAADADDRGYTLALQGTPGSSEYVLVRDGAGPWQPVGLDGDGRAQVRITRGFHGVLSGCRTLGLRLRRLDVILDAGGSPDAPIALPACGTPVIRVVMSGHTTPADATIVVDNTTVTASAGFYQVTPHRGVADVIAHDPGAAHALILRDVELTADTTLDLDVAGQGFAMASAAVTVTGAGTDRVQVTSELHRRPGVIASFATGPTEAFYVPAAQRVADERVDVYVTASEVSGNRARLVQHAIVDGALAVFALPPFPPLAVDRAGVAWSGDWDVANLALVAPGGIRAIGVQVSRAWQLGTGADRVPWIEPGTLPGWDPADVIFAPGEEVQWSVFLSSGAFDGESVSAADSGPLVW